MCTNYISRCFDFLSLVCQLCQCLKEEIYHHALCCLVYMVKNLRINVKNVSFCSCAVGKAFCCVAMWLLTLAKIMFVLMRLITYCMCLANSQIGLQLWIPSWKGSIPVFRDCYSVFPFPRRGLETLRNWEGGREGFISPKSSAKSPPLAPCRRDCYFPFVFLKQLQVEDSWNL